MKLFRRRESRRGQGVVEYGLILGLIALAIIAGALATGESISNIHNHNSTTISNALSSTS